jgi:hypothetical protein
MIATERLVILGHGIVHDRSRILLNRLGVVFGDASAFGVHHTEVALRPRIPLLGERFPKLKGFLVITRVVSGSRILIIPRHHGSGEQHDCG